MYVGKILIPNLSGNNNCTKENIYNRYFPSEAADNLTPGLPRFQSGKIHNFIKDSM